MSTSIGRAAGDNSENILNSVASNINNTANFEKSVKQAQQLLDIMGQLHNEVKDLNDGNNIDLDFSKTLTQLNEVRDKISSIVNEIKQLSQNGVQFDTDNAVREVNKLKEASEGAVSHVQELVKQIGGNTEASNKFNAMFGEMSRSMSQFQQQVGETATVAETALGGVQSSVQKTAQVVTENVDKISGDIGNLNNLSPQPDFTVFSSSLTKQFEELHKTIENGSKNLSDQFTVLRDLGEKTAGAAFDSTAQIAAGLKNVLEGSLKELGSIFGPDFNGILKPDEISAKFNDFSKEIIANVEKQQSDLLKTLLNGLPGNDFNMLSSDALKQIEGVYKDFDKTYGAVITLANSSVANLAIEAKKGVDGATEAMEQVKTQIAKIQQERQNIQSDISNANTQVFHQSMQEVLDPNTGVGKDYNAQYIDRKLGQFSWVSSLSKQSENIQRSAQNLQDRLDNDHTLSTRNITSISSGVNIEKIMQDTTEMDKLLRTFEKNKKLVIDQVSEAYASGDSTKKENAEKKLKELVSLSQAINSRMTDVADSINVSPNDIKNVSELRDLVNHLQGGLKSSKTYFRNLYDAAKMFGVDPGVLKDIEKMNTELSQTQNHFNKLGDSSKSLWSTITGGIKDFLAPLSLAGAAGGLLGVSGLPIGLSGMKQYWSGSSDYYKKQAAWAVDAMKAEAGMGDTIDPTGAQFRVYDQGRYYHNLTNGMINFQDFNNAYTNLVKNVGGQVGGNDAQTIRDLNNINDNTFAGQKLYNISDNTMADFTKTYYKDLRQSAEDVSYSFMKIAQTATIANIPVETYMKTVTQLASQYRKLGLSSDSSMNVMDKFISQGMSIEDAQSMAQTMGQATNKFADNESMWLLSSAMSGNMGADMFSSLRLAKDRWNPDGTIKTGFAKVAAENIDTMASIYGGLGNSEDSKWWATNKFVTEGLGATGFEASQLTNALMKDDYKTFESLLSEMDSGEDKKTVILEGKQELESALGTLSSHLSKATEMEALLADGQYQLAHTSEDMRDTLLTTFTPTVERLIKAADTLTGALNTLVSKIMGNPVSGGLVNTMAEHPLATLGALWAGGKVASKGMDAGLSKLGKLFTGKSGKVVAEGVDAAADSGLSKFLGNLGKSKNSKVKGIALIAAALGTGLAIDSFIGDRTQQNVLNNGINNNNLYSNPKTEQDITGIYDTLKTKVSQDAWKDSQTPTNPIVLYGNTLQTYTGVNGLNGLNGLNMQTGGVLTSQGSTYVPGISDLTSPSVGETMSRIAIESVVTEGLSKIFGIDDMIKAGKVTSDVAAGTAVKTASKFGLKGTLKATGANILADAAVNLWDPLKHTVKGDVMKEDWGKAGASFLTDSAFTIAGTLIGSLLGPGGAIAGGIIAGGAELAIDMATQDKNGRGAITRFKDNLTETFTGYNEEDLEIKRLITQGKTKDFMSMQMQTFGVSKESADIMVKALQEHADKISKFSSEDKYNWALMFANMKQQNPGASEKDIIKELDGIFSNGNEELKESLISEINTQLATNSSTTIEEVRKTKEEIISNVNKTKTAESDFNKGFNPIYEAGVKQNASDLGISVEEYNKALENTNSLLHEEVKNLDDKLRKKANKAGDKTLKEGNAEADAIKNTAIGQISGLTDNYNVLSTYANQQGKQDLKDVFNIKSEIQKEFLSARNLVPLMTDVLGNIPSGEEVKQMQKYLLGTASEKEALHVQTKFDADTIKYGDYKEKLNNAYRIQGSQDVFIKELGNEKGNKYFERYKNEMMGKKQNTYENMGEEDEYQKTIEKIQNKIDANATNILTEENKFKQEFIDKVKDSIETGNTDILKELYNANELTGQEKTILDSINSNIQLLQIKGVVGGETSPLFLNGQTPFSAGQYYRTTTSTPSFMSDIALELDPLVKYGELSALRESTNNIADVSKDGDAIAYGKYQLNSKHGKLSGFLDEVKKLDEKGYNKYFADARTQGLESQALKDAWIAYANDKPELFETMQDNFIASQYYKPAADYTNSKGIKLDERSDALKNVIWQLSNNLGTGGYQNALNGIQNASTLNDRELIAQLYEQAGMQKDINKGWYEGSKNIAYEMLSREGYTDGPTTTGTYGSADVSSGNDPFSMFGTSTKEWSEQQKGINTPFTRGTLLYGVLPEGFNKSSYMTGDSKDTFSQLKTTQAILNAGGANDAFSMNVQALSKSFRQNLDNQRKAAAEASGKTYYDNFATDLSPNNESSIYRTDSIYKASENKLSTAAEEIKDSNKAVIGMNVTTNQNIDAKKLAEIIQRALRAEGIDASIEEIKADIAALAKSLGKTVEHQNTFKKEQY